MADAKISELPLVTHFTLNVFFGFQPIKIIGNENNNVLNVCVCVCFALVLGIQIKVLSFKMVQDVE